MTRDELIQYIVSSNIFKKWHWFNYHFAFYLRNSEHTFARSIVDACLSCDAVLPGFAHKMIDAISSISGKEKWEPHYEQLLQRLAELHVIHQILTFPWPQRDELQFRYEPTVGGSRKNPELTLFDGHATVGFEVKAPALLTHMRMRQQNSVQFTSRVQALFQAQQSKSEPVTLPRDNPIKDFLKSADAKFQSFSAQGEFIGILIIVWDDFINEPIAALLSPASGLFTDNSFAMNDQDEPLRFENVHGVIIIRHLHQLVRVSQDKHPIDNCQHALDYGRNKEFPPKAFLSNPHSNNGGQVPKCILQCLQAYTLSPEMGAEYQPGEVIVWV